MRWKIVGAQIAPEQRSFSKIDLRDIALCPIDGKAIGLLLTLGGELEFEGKFVDNPIGSIGDPHPLAFLLLVLHIAASYPFGRSLGRGGGCVRHRGALPSRHDFHDVAIHSDTGLSDAWWQDYHVSFPQRGGMVSMFLTCRLPRCSI
ncbi:hypothetical protein [Mesorhizobium sp. M3A.F.Ca.ET.201.01.1.1]|uniref:hypothetical protein n=1 Tax=Mesorhizobium sp. M3A.F.Ca.ET.201.01.1.1 TaxID=2563946 RepID=UPI00167B45E3|nr:hypothetical protein [Mesorhizobium sp. M3A.F.Ca.ET.201.01.1.1]